MENLLQSATHTSANQPRALRAARWAVAALFFVNGALFANWVSRIPAIQMERGLSHGALGLVLLAVALGALVAMPLAGWCATRFGSARVCRWSALGYCGALSWLAFAPNLSGFVVGLFFFGAAHGALDVAMNAQAVDVERQYTRPIMSSFHALFSFGGLAGAMTGGLVAATGVGPLVHFSVVSVLLAGASAMIILPRLLRDAETEIPERLKAPLETKAALGRPSMQLLVLGIIAFCVMMGEGAMADWSAIFLRRVTGASESLAAAGYAAFSVAMAIGRLSGDRLSMRFSAVTLVRSSGLLAAGGLTLALAVGNPLIALIGFAAVGAGFATVVPLVFSAAGRAAGIASGPALATVTTIGYFGFLIGPPLIGLAAEFLGLPGALASVVVTSLLLVVLAGGVAPRAEAQRPPAAHSRQASKVRDYHALQEIT